MQWNWEFDGFLLISLFYFCISNSPLCIQDTTFHFLMRKFNFIKQNLCKIKCANSASQKKFADYPPKMNIVVVYKLIISNENS